ncbi:MAG: tyrosine-type recombinase/integrase [Pseudomonadota bacterium]
MELRREDISDRDVERFVARTSRDPNGGCWFFAGAPDGGGYGRFGCNGRQVMAHRFAYLVHHGPIDTGLVIDHTCGNRRCVNPAHLEAVTTAENNRRGRSARHPDPVAMLERRRVGAGSLQRRGNRWRLVVDIGRDPVTGQRRQRTRMVAGSRADAEKALALLVAGSTTGDPHLGKDSSLGDLLDAWMAVARLSPATALDYRRAISKHIPPHMKSMRVWKITTHQLDQLYSALQDKGLGPARIRRVHNILRRSLGQAVKWQWIARNPAVDASPPPLEQPSITPPPVDDVRRWVDACDGPMRVYAVLAAHLGARRGELCALQWGDIDLDAGEITIRRALTEGGPGVGIVAKPTKTNRDRTVAIDPATVGLLRAHRHQRLQDALAAGARPGPWVFATDPLGHVAPRPDSMSRRFSRLRDELGLGHVRPHDLRHFVATQLLAAGVDPRTVSGRLGHSRTSTTLDIYAAFVPARDRDAADLLGRLLG